MGDFIFIVGWKNLPYWLRGGIVGSSLNILLFVLILVIAKIFGDYALILAFTIVPFVSPFFFGVSPLFFLDLSLPYNLNIPFFVYQFLNILIPLIVYFVIGAIIGWIYGKIKVRNQNKN